MKPYRFAAVADDMDTLPAGTGHTEEDALDDLHGQLADLVDCGHTEPGAYAVTVYSGVRWHAPCGDVDCDTCCSIEDHYGRPLAAIVDWAAKRQTTITVEITP